VGHGPQIPSNVLPTYDALTRDGLEGDVLTRLAGSQCTVFWADLTIFDDRYTALLSAAELRRAARLAKGAVRDRFVLGAALLRCAVSAGTGIDPVELAIERACRWCFAPHGKPRLLGDARGWHASVTHSGSLVGVALTRAGRVGLDVELAAAREYRSLCASVLAADEPPPRSLRDFLGYWTRKESVLKATGEGLVRPMPDIVVTAPSAAPRLISYSGRPAPATMIDMRPRRDYVSALTVLGSEPVAIVQQHVSALPLERSA
jgi:4'-phosphopantetheinyl transferase